MAFQLAGQIADGALTWVCPVPYLLRTGIPALRSSAAAVGRSAPLLAAHIPVALSENRHSVLTAGHQMLDFYAKILWSIKYRISCGSVETFSSSTAAPNKSTDLIVKLLLFQA